MTILASRRHQTEITTFYVGVGIPPVTR